MIRRSLRLLSLALLLLTVPAAGAAYDPNKPFEPELGGLLQQRDYQGALTRTRSLLEASPDDWQLRALIPSLYARLGDDEAFERETEALRKLRDTSSDTSVRTLKGFPVQALAVGDRVAMIHRCLEQPDKPLQPLYVAFVSDKGAARPDQVIALNRTAREFYKELGIKGADWALDSYRQQEHATITFFEKQPSFAAFKAAIESSLKGGGNLSSSNKDGRGPLPANCR